MAIIGLWMSVLPVHSGVNIDSLLENASNSLFSSCIILNFKMTVNHEMRMKPQTAKGTLQCCGMDRFRLNMKELLVISDGKVMWSYSKKNKQVVIQDAGDGKTLNPLQIFDAYRTKDVIINANRVSYDSRKVWKISLSAKKRKSGIKYFLLYLNSKDLLPVALTYKDWNGNSTKYEIDRIKRKQLISPIQFQFEAGAGIEVFDNRKN